jgi:hypothetical protein
VKAITGGLGSEKWKLIVALAVVVGVLILIGQGSHLHVSFDMRAFQRDPLGTLQDIATRGGMVMLAIGALLHFTPWTKGHGAAIVEGVLTGLGIIFIGIPGAAWVLTHLGLIWATLSSLGAG